MILAEERRELWKLDDLKNSSDYVKILLRERLIKLVNRTGAGSIAFRMLWNSGVRIVKDVGVNDLEKLS